MCPSLGIQTIVISAFPVHSAVFPNSLSSTDIKHKDVIRITVVSLGSTIYQPINQPVHHSFNLSLTHSLTHSISQASNHLLALRTTFIRNTFRAARALNFPLPSYLFSASYWANQISRHTRNVGADNDFYVHQPYFYKTRSCIQWLFFSFFCSGRWNTLLERMGRCLGLAKRAAFFAWKSISTW